MRFERKIIETDRLLLRPYEARDAARLVELISNWDIARMLARVPYPYPRSLADEWIASHDAQREAGESPFAIEADGELIGSTGLHEVASGEIETGYWIGEPYWGRGYASEAFRALLRHAFGDLGLERIVAGHFRENHASGRVLTKAGFKYTGQGHRFSLARGHEVEHLQLQLTRADAGALDYCLTTRPQQAEKEAEKERS